MQIVSFDNYTPPARFDSVPWLNALVYEAAASAGPWTLIDTLALEPLDLDPSEPQARFLTTALATAAELWHRLVWTDDNGGESAPTVAVQDVTETTTSYATAEELAQILKVKYPDREEELNRVLVAAAFEINEEIGVDGPMDPAPALVVEVNLERAVEHWHQQQSPWGIVGLGGVEGSAMHTATDSWQRHAAKLAYLKQEWGIA